MHEQREKGKIQRNNYHHGSCGPSLTGKTMPVFLVFTEGTHRNVENHSVKSAFKLSNNTSRRASFKKPLSSSSDRKPHDKEPVVLWLPNVYIVVVND